MNDNEVSIKVTGQNTSQPAVDGARRSMKGLKDEAGETSVKVRVLGESVSSTAKKTDELGDKTRKTTRELSALDRKILELRASTIALGREFEKTGDTSLLKKFRTDSRELAGLERMRKQISGLTGDVERLGSTAAKVAKAGGGRGGEGLNFQAIPINPEMVGIGAGLATAAAPAIGGATIAGAGLAAAGGAAFAGYLAAPKQVGAAWATEISKIKAQFTDAGKSAVDPTIKAVHELGSAVEAVHFDRIIEKGAQYLEPIAKATGTAFRYIAAGVETIIDKAGPEMEVLAKEVPEVGRAVQMALEAISDGSEGGAKALTDLFHVIEGVIVGTGEFVGALEKGYGWLSKASDATRDWVGSWHPLVGEMNEATEQGKSFARYIGDARTNTDDLGQAGGEAIYTLDQRMRDALDTVDRLNTGFEHMFGILMSVDEATIRYQQSIDDLASNWDRAGRSLDANSQAGRDNLRLIEDIIQAIDAQREAAIRAGGGTQEAYDAANGAYLQQLKNLRAQLAALGANTAAVDALIAKYEELAKPLTKHVTVVIDQVGSVSREGVVSGGDQRRRTGAAYAHGGIVGAASGMVLSGLADVGEQGREIALLAPGRALLPPGSQVIPNGMTESMLARGGSGQAPVVIHVYGSVISERELLTTISNNVKDLGGRPELLGLKAA